MTDNEITFNISFEAKSSCFNEFVNMIVRDSRWPTNVSFVSYNAAVGRLVSTDWAKVDFPNMIEVIVANGYTVTVTDVNTYTITKTVLGTVTTEKQSAATTLDKKRRRRHKRKP
ncbi:uncharacterized protein Z520_12059 [Fonsecaea multimorphosa CBS 102226]|uniref:Uncharacterized protein n=1 Tax=Fonsecaea multimorphosa CBS 102226 TaxID=1442371 RepID=A0A0D2K762_9EURO|nr:uncharacterized protein Z520_12059 [Fonsecaea multimorphosa CBS 102226]KIX92178.1 hypothetical protein Z520_12059 [Fonsecaea multimorphosa CBS 102226]OAL17611.1 hypothetical protein AYO22_11473 [Fonsecaea multimorphosa]